MSEQARICKSCGRENQGHAKFCAQCGAELAPFGMRNFLIAAGLTVLPFAATPIVLVTWTAADSGGGDYDVLGAALLSILAIPVYLLIGGITSAVVWRRNRSAAAGVLAGLGVGAMAGVASCFASLSAFG